MPTDLKSDPNKPLHSLLKYTLETQLPSTDLIASFVLLSPLYEWIVDEGLEDRKKRVSLVSHNSHSVHAGYPAERGGGGGGNAVREK